PEQRFHSAHDIGFALEALTGTSAPVAAIRTGGPKLPRPILFAGVGLLGLLAGFAAGRFAAPDPAQPPEIRPLTYSGRDWDPAASPDGKTVAFASDREGRTRIWLKQIAGGNEAALTDGPVDTHPRFSADGSSILFARAEGAEVALYRVALVGGAPRRVVADAFQGDWSPDGTRIAFVRKGRGGFGTEIGIVSADGSGARSLAGFPGLDLKAPRWTPDGRAILAVQGAGASTTPGLIHWLSADGRQHRVFSPPESRGELSSIAWSSGRMVYMQGASATSATRTVTGRVLLQEPGSSRAKVLLQVSNFGETLDVLGSGRLIFDADFSHQNLREVPAPDQRRAAPARWITRGRSSDREPTYSPDGQRLLFASDRGGNLDIWEITLANGALRRLTDDPAEDWDPALSPDGKRLVWSSNRSGHFEIWTADPDGSDPRLVTHDGVDAENPEMTPDGRWVTYTSANPSRSGLWKIHPDGSGDTKIAGGSAIHPEISPDGAYVLYHVPYTAVRVARLTGGEILPFSIDLKPLHQLGRSRWLPDGKAIAFVGSNAEKRAGVFVQAFSAGAADTSATRRVLAGFEPDLPTESFAISPDGTRIVLSEIELRGDILVAEGVAGIVSARRAAK
ncbi:MAG: LpqB family beta-propeller domain-containing protein, partial [Acidobacteriota bacterium]